MQVTTELEAFYYLSIDYFFIAYIDIWYKHLRRYDATGTIKLEI